MTPRQAELERLLREYGLLAVYLFGSRAPDGRRHLAGEAVDPAGSDLDVGVYFVAREVDILAVAGLQMDLADLFSPLRLDLVVLRQVDALFQFNALCGDRVAVADPFRADLLELSVMRRAAELLPFQRRRDLTFFGRVLT